MEVGGPPESFSPWKRKRPVNIHGAIVHYQNSFQEKFDEYTDANIDLDIHTKRAVLKVSASVVSLVSLTGGMAIFMGSGTIIDCEDVNGTYLSSILTSASLLRSSTELDAAADNIKVDVHISDGKLFEGQVFAYDFHYNIAIIKIESDAPLPSASLRLLDDSISVDPSEIPCPGDKAEGSESFQLRRHSNLFNLCPGDLVVAIGRYFDKPYELMAAPGKFSLDCCEFDCRELFRANCNISKCGIGGPLINRYGEVIGVNFYDELCTPFLPINIASKCLEHFKKYGRFCRPWLGMEMTNLYAASVEKLEKIVQKFPNIFKGVIVEEVIPGSPADCAGILRGDVIVQCGRNFVRSFLEVLSFADNTYMLLPSKLKDMDSLILHVTVFVKRHKVTTANSFSRCYRYAEMSLQKVEFLTMKYVWVEQQSYSYFQLILSAWKSELALNQFLGEKRPAQDTDNSKNRTRSMKVI